MKIMMRVMAIILMLGFVLSGTGSGAAEMRAEDHELNPDSPKSLSGENIELKTSDGKTFRVYAAGPAGARRGILVIHEWWGLNDHIRSWTDRFAGLGYRAMAVDLYGGKVAATPEEAMGLMKSVDQKEANAKHRAVLDALKAPGRKLGTIGWCFGGGQSLQASLAAPGSVSATVIYYGRTVTDADRLRTLRAPVLGIFAERDAGIPVEQVKAFEAAMKQAGRDLELHFYDADHAFANPSGNRYDSEAAVAAWKVTRAFLDKHLK